MKAIIKIDDIPDFQIGHKVSIYFPDTMRVEGIVEKDKTGTMFIIHNKGEKSYAECAECHHETKDTLSRYCSYCGRKVEWYKEV